MQMWIETTLCYSTIKGWSASAKSRYEKTLSKCHCVKRYSQSFSLPNDVRLYHKMCFNVRINTVVFKCSVSTLWKQYYKSV